ncbi:MAG: hypothetical protein KDC35_19575 [Acidobacteria bacterium]|nr:hypothetical protein [Acidobacteriota bacterium]
MVLFNYATKELTAKVVYYGPGLCGKTSNLQYIYDTLPDVSKGKMLSLATKTDRTLFFDFLPIDLGSIRGMKTKIQLYTVPGQVFYDTTRKLVLKGADGVVFVADSQEPMLEANIDSFDNLITNLKEQNQDLSTVPHVIQYNKRDMKNALTIEQLEKEVNRFNMPHFEAIAVKGDGVFETLKGISKLVLKNLTAKYGLEMEKDKLAASSAAPARKPPSLPPVGAQRPASPAPALPKPQTSAPLAPDPSNPFDEEPIPMSVDEIEFEDEEVGSANSVGSLPSESAQDKLPQLDDSEVIELDDMGPLEVAELDEMAEIANLASEGRNSEGRDVKSDDVEPISVPVNITLPASLAGKPIRLQIDISFDG